MLASGGHRINQTKGDKLSEYRSQVLRLRAYMQVSKAGPEGQTETPTEDSASWVPLILQLGLPLQPDNLCQAVCKYVPLTLLPESCQKDWVCLAQCDLLCLHLCASN